MLIKINEFTIGQGCKPFIIAEAGINHNGEIEKAVKMIKIAKKAGVNAIKFQTFKAEELMADSKQMFTYTSQGKEVTESMLEMFKRYEFSREEWFKIKQKCDDEEIMFLSTPQNKSDLNLLLELNVPAIKVGSDDFVNLPLLEDYTTTNLPLLVSCGMSNLSEVFQALDTIGTLKDNYPTVLLLTTSQYPTPPNDVNLNKLKTLSKTFPNLPLGFSDHTQGVLASSLAVALGACVFEKHFTSDHNLPGPDHWFSEDSIGLTEWTNSVRNSFRMLGSELIKPTIKEEKIKKIARRSVASIKDISEGEILDSSNIGLRRPGDGLPPYMIKQIYGMKTTKKILKGTRLSINDFF